MWCCRCCFPSRQMIEGGVGAEENGGDSPLGHRKAPSFAFQLGSLAQEARQDFDEIWPRNEIVHSKTTNDYGHEIESSLEAVLKNKIANFRESLHLPSLNRSTTLHELLRRTLEDLQLAYPKCVSCIQISEVNCRSTHQVLVSFYTVLKFVGDLCVQKKSKNFGVERDVDIESLSSQQLGERMLDRLNLMSLETKEMFDVMEKDSVISVVSECRQGKSSSNLGFPLTPTSVLSETSEHHLPLPVVRPLRLNDVGKLNPLDRNRLVFRMVPLILDQNSNADGIVVNNGDDDTQSGMSTPTTPNSETSKSIEATAILLTPQSHPILQLRSPAPLSSTPTPPSSPMVLKGLYMPLFDSALNMEPIAYAMMINDIDDYLLTDTDMYTSYTSEAGLSTTPPPARASQFREEPQPPSSSPASRDEPRPCPSPPGSPPPLPPPVAPPPPPPPQSRCAPMPPPPPTRPLKGTATLTPPPPLPPGKKGSGQPPPPLPPGREGSGQPPPPPLSPGSSPPLPSSPPLKAVSGPLPPVPPQAGGSGPPPPSFRALSVKNTKLKRSSQMGNLYRLLKGRVEGPSLNGKASQPKKSQAGGKSGGSGGQGMADALAEITRRSSYFQQIEEDVKNHGASILQLKSSISSFRTSDMTELTKFHKHVEMHLEKLTDESQVLARFEDFPTKKLETIRMAVALYSKLEAITTTINNWKLTSPIGQQLEKIESYFNKIKEEVDAIDRNKDEESKRFKSHSIEVDFNILVRIKESMVDLSSSCIEMALKESKEAKKANSKSASPTKMLWRAFQLAFRVYNFAGGQDERADRLTSELAHEIETYSQI